MFAIGMGDWPTIPMAGGEGLALWYDSTSGEFVSSEYFYADLPQWVKEWNKTDPVKQFLDKHVPRDEDGSWVWELLHDEQFYRNSGRNEVNSRSVEPPC